MAATSSRTHFLDSNGDLDSALLQIPAPQPTTKLELVAELDAAVTAMRKVPWTTLEELKGNPDVVARLDDAEDLLRSLRRALTS